MDRERLKGNLELLPSVLSSAPAHGYAVISALRDRSLAAGPAWAEPGWSA